MKFGFKLSDIKVGDKATIGNVEVNVQYNPGEMIGEYKLFRKALGELPEIVADLGNGALAFDKMDKAFDDVSKAQHAEGATEESKQSAINQVMEVIKSLRVDNTGKTVEQEIAENKAV